jgi:PAS domain S-box-containing protein
VKRLDIMPRASKIYFHFIISVGLALLLIGFSLLFISTTSPIYRPMLFILVLILVINVIVHLILKDMPDKSKLLVIEKKEEPEKPQVLEHVIQPKPLSSPPPEEAPISEEKQEELKDETVLSNIGEGLVIINKLGKIITFNKAAQSLLGWSQHEALGKDFADIVRIDFDNSINKNQTIGHQSSLHFIRKDNTKFPAAITTSSYVQGDNILGTITLFRDVTAERNIDKMKNEFISLASHQLRTPLAAIKWYAKMLTNGDAGKLLPEQAEYADSIYTSTVRMIDLVNSLLNITRIESGRIIVEPKPTELNKMVAEVVEEVKIRYLDKKQKLNVRIPSDLPIISIDPRLIRQVYVNLLTNAAKYTPEKGEISVILSKTDTEIISEIRDNGYGIPASEQEKVFGKFYRGTNAVSGANDGTGLGLYLIKSIVELSQGRIWFKSEESKGTSFWFSLPLAGTFEKKGSLSIET